MVAGLTISAFSVSRAVTRSSIWDLTALSFDRDRLIGAASELRPALDRSMLRLLQDIEAALTTWRGLAGGDELDIVQTECARLENANSKALLLQRSLASFHEVTKLTRQTLRKLETDLRDSLRSIERLRCGVRQSHEQARALQVRSAILHRQDTFGKSRKAIRA